MWHWKHPHSLPIVDDLRLQAAAAEGWGSPCAPPHWEVNSSIGPLTGLQQPQLRIGRKMVFFTDTEG